MKSKIIHPNLLQCSRVDVLDVRPVLRKGDLPFDSIRNSLSLLDDDSTLVVVTPFEPGSLEKFVRRQGWSFRYDCINETTHWLAVHRGRIDHDLEINAPGPSYVVPGGEAGCIGYLDCRGMESEETVDWINSTLPTLDTGDLLVVHGTSWNDRHEEDLSGSCSNRKSINADHVRIEIRPEEP